MSTSMKKSKNNSLIVISLLIYIVAAAAMAAGTAYDLQITVNLFNPQNTVVKLFEAFGQFVYWGLWGPAFTVIFLCRRNLNECLAVTGRLLPFIKPFKNTQGKAYKIFNFILRLLTTAAFFVLSVIGWKKLTENIIKNILDFAGADNLSQPVYFIINIAIAVIAILVFKKIDKEKLKKIEALALAGVLLGIFYKTVEEFKGITSRVRVREMIAYSNGILNENGLSDGKSGELTRLMAEGTDFSAFTPWYRKGSDIGIYSHADSFPSGHTLYACTSFLLYPALKAYRPLKKYAPLALLFAFAYTAAMAFTRLVAGAHYLTDVAGAVLIGYTLFLIVYGIYIKFTKKKIIG